MRLTLTTQHTHYPIIIQPGSVGRFDFPAEAIVVYDQTLAPTMKRLFPKRRHLAVVVNERRKRLRTIEKVCEQLVALGCDRKSSLIAVGGGVLGDIVGFVASIYMRGIPYYHVPTTLLAMVDSSIGGKTGVDLAVGKNLVGTIYQPKAVIIDPQFLVSLPATQFANGMAEVVKHGILFPPLFSWLEKHTQAIIRRDLKTLYRMIALSVEVKVGIVEQDEREHRERMLLNLGHTFGHALEKVSRYRIPHGQAVAYGLAYVTAYTNMPERARVLWLLQNFGLATELKQPFSPEQLVQTMLADKKHEGSSITLVLPKTLGHMVICHTITPAVIKRFLWRYHSGS